jgi:Flp pilus assembly protein TadG
MMHASDTACVGERRRLGVRIGRRLIVKGISQSRAWLLLPAKDLFNILGPVGHFACRFIRANDGNIAVLFAIAFVPILCFVGVAVDYSRVAAARTALQGALDSTALMLSKDLSSGVISTSQIPATAQSYFAGLFKRSGVGAVSLNATYTQANGSVRPTIQVSGSSSIDTAFMEMFGFPRLGFNASSTTTWGGTLLRVALVLDNTASMLDYNKIGALTTAAKALVTQLSQLAANNGDVYISVIPFELDVNVGTSNVDAGWLRWDLWDPSNFPYSGDYDHTWCNSGYWLTMAQCLGHGYRWQHTPNTSDKSKWNGCVTDRDQNYDVNSAAPGTYSYGSLTSPAGAISTFLADQDSSCPSTPILPLTNDWSAIKSTINSLQPSGATNQTIGLQWGWLSLLQQAPLNAPPESSTFNYQHIIVLFTDGLNTGDRWYGDLMHVSSDVDTRMKALCDNIRKTTKITVYTVQIDTDGDGPSPVLPYCATNRQNFFMLTQPSQIASAFAQIFVDISRLRIAK